MRHGRPMRRRCRQHDVTSPCAHRTFGEHSAVSPGNGVTSRPRPGQVPEQRLPVVPAGNARFPRGRCPGPSRLLDSGTGNAPPEPPANPHCCSQIPRISHRRSGSVNSFSFPICAPSDSLLHCLHAWGNLNSSGCGTAASQVWILSSSVEILALNLYSYSPVQDKAFPGSDSKQRPRLVLVKFSKRKSSWAAAAMEFWEVLPTEFPQEGHGKGGTHPPLSGLQLKHTRGCSKAASGEGR